MVTMLRGQELQVQHKIEQLSEIPGGNLYQQHKEATKLSSKTDLQNIVRIVVRLLIQTNVPTYN